MNHFDELLKGRAAWLKQAVAQPVFGQVDEKQLNFPEEQLQRRKDDLNEWIAGLEARKQATIGAYDGAIASARQELKTLEGEASQTTTSFSGILAQGEQGKDSKS